MPPTRQLIRQASSPRRKLNLAHKKRSSARPTYWYIGKRQSSHIYYMVEFDSDNSVALWSKYKKDGMTFKTETGVQKFIATYMSNRTDIMLIRVEE